MQTLKAIEQEQNAAIVNNSALLEQSILPKQGWIRTLRTALAMSGAALSQRLGGHRSVASYLERAELDESITLKKLNQVAAAMNCKLVYAFVPQTKGEDVNDLLEEQAEYKARNIVQRTNVQMVMEAQALSLSAQEKEIKRLKEQLLKDLPRDFWTKLD